MNFSIDPFPPVWLSPPVPKESKLIPHLEKIQEWRRAGFLYSQIAIKLTEYGVRIEPQTLGRFCRQWGIQFGREAALRVQSETGNRGPEKTPELKSKSVSGEKKMSASERARIRIAEEKKAEAEKDDDFDMEEMKKLVEQEAQERRKRAGGK